MLFANFGGWFQQIDYKNTFLRQLANLEHEFVLDDIKELLLIRLWTNSIVIVFLEIPSQLEIHSKGEIIWCLGCTLKYSPEKMLREGIVEIRLAKFWQLMRPSNGDIGIIASFVYIWDAL